MKKARNNGCRFSRFLALAVSVIMVLSILTACSELKQSADLDESKKTVTVTTSFLRDMVTVLVGDKVNLQMIIPAGEDPHLYKPLPEDSKKIKNADLVLYHGLHFEGKMVEALEEYGVSVSKNFSPDDLGIMDQDGEMIVDPHFWFNLDLYSMACENAAEALGELLPEEKDEIQKNLLAYQEQLKETDAWIREELTKIPEESRYLITPHDAFNYFSRSYGMPVQAPQGVSTDSEVSSKAVEETVNLIVEKKIKAIFAESTTDPARMEKLREDCKAKGFDVKVVHGDGQELFSDSLAPLGEPGDNFIDMVRHNVSLIVENLK